MKYSGIGGQGVIEGIMMKNSDAAMRRPSASPMGTIVVKKDTVCKPDRERSKCLSRPFIRGIFNFADSMVLGIRALICSASFFEDDEGMHSQESFELFLDQVFGEKLEKVLMVLVMVFSVILAVVIFMVFPLLAASNIFRRFISSETVMAVLEGVIRLLIFIVYIKLVSSMEDILRTYMYHGAEHKCINCMRTRSGMPRLWKTYGKVRNSISAAEPVSLLSSW